MQDHEDETKAVPGDLSSVAAQDATDEQALPVESKELEVAPPERAPIPQLKQILEGAILAAHKPLNIDRLRGLFDEHTRPGRACVRTALEEIRDDCKGRGFELKQIASGYRFQIRHEYAEWIGRLWDEKPPRYSRAFLETLALIAYKQPITRGDIEEIRGVSVSTNIMRSLLEREWICILGHRHVPGRPALYGTTREFLDYFDLSSLDQLPLLAEIKDPDGENEVLDLSGEALIQPHTLSLAAADHADGDTEDTPLEEVTARVNQIQENIKNLCREPEARAPDADPEDEQIMVARLKEPPEGASDLDAEEPDDPSHSQEN